MKKVAYFTTVLSSLLLVAALCSCNPVESPTPTPKRGRLSIEAQIIYNAGGPQPVARDTFYLVDTDLLDVEVPQRRKDETFQQTLMRQTPAQALKFTVEIAKALEKLRMLAREQGRDFSDTPVEGVNLKTVWLEMELLKRDKETAHHFIQAATTDFQGRTIFESIEPGDYWVMGATQTRADFAFWNYKVTVAPGENKVLLDQNNALYSK